MADSGLDKSLLAFLNGISKRIYLGEGDSITDDFLRDEILKVTHEGKHCEYDFEYEDILAVIPSGPGYYPLAPLIQ